MNRRSDWFAMRLSQNERELLDQLARREARTMSDVVRSLIRQAVQNNERTPAALKDDRLVAQSAT
jgi:predicted DNA-binding protein